MKSGRAVLVNDRLKELRHKNNLRQSDMAAIASVSTQTYAGYENKKTQPTADVLIKYSDYFNVSIDWLCGRNDVKGTWPETYDDLVKIIQKLITIGAILPSNKNHELSENDTYTLECNKFLSSILHKLDKAVLQLHLKEISEFDFYATCSILMETIAKVNISE